ncbi:hypothetical protein N473_25705 [Pseudoalteromonas luteoviolacea CPMOR-1]|uniref:Lipoprotein n=1 Tax=Pseudoalteromonas luteoviolacea CPMOR-1 TaxID=1365248 RepID=A0A167IHA1_9GAMM|nr:hypothetical protein [Pseudoalteromonas luteoviolacea]KZN59532.1 hypothetical protein N473_25705 [Pseudoalteromonas luteoviolacea CPMOR-1]
MKLKTLLLLAFSSTFLIACKSNDSGATANSKADKGYRCKQVRSLGSNIPTTYCSTKKQRAEAREQAKRDLRDAQRVSTVNSGN